MKLSNTQKKLYDKTKEIIEILNKYSTFEDFFDNSKGEQNTFTTAWHCNELYNSSEKYRNRNPEWWAKSKEDFYKARDEHIIIVKAKTETINALVKAGLIEVIEPAKYKGGFETIKLL